MLKHFLLRKSQNNLLPGCLLLALLLAGQAAVFAAEELKESCHRHAQSEFSPAYDNKSVTRLPRRSLPAIFIYRTHGFSRRWLTHLMYPTFCRMALCNSSCLKSYLLNEDWESLGLNIGLHDSQVVPCTVDKTPVFASHNKDSGCCTTH